MPQVNWKTKYVASKPFLVAIPYTAGQNDNGTTVWGDGTSPSDFMGI